MASAKAPFVAEQAETNNRRLFRCGLISKPSSENGTGSRVVNSELLFPWQDK